MIITYILVYSIANNKYSYTNSKNREVIIILEVNEMYEDFVRERITQLRLKKGVSEYQMSYDLGHSRGYVYNISSGKALPPLKEFFSICEYFDISPAEFFNIKTENPKLSGDIIALLEQLDEADLELVLRMIQRLLQK